MRADALRNRGRILDAAAAVFADQGPSASTEEIAERAGVAIGTIFRHFPTKEALIRAVVDVRLRDLAEQARAALADPEPGPAFYAFLERCVEQAATKHSFADAMPAAGLSTAAVYEVVEDGVVELAEGVERLLTRAQQAGAVRPDVGVAEVTALVVGVARALEVCVGDAALRARTQALMLSCLRPA